MKRSPTLPNQAPRYVYPDPQPIDLSLLAALPNLPLRSRYLVNSFLHGMHRSPLKGESVEFAEYRGYQQGDDIRHIDWRLLARSDRLYVKTFEQETQMRVFLVLDASASMAYSSPRAALTKLDFAKTVLGGLAHLAKRQGDPYGCAVALGGLQHYLKPRLNSMHLQALLAALETPTAAGEDTFAQTVDTLANLLPRRSLLILASDFYEEPERMRQTLNRLRYDGHDVIGLQVLDPQECDLADENSGVFFDLEDFSEVTLSTEEIRRSYLREFGQFRSDLRHVFEDEGAALVELITDHSPVQALGQYLAKREHQL
ncbi:MAG: hypothetical protein CML13_13140 [Puniceicoccaceae bacterium]|nr:hypothetical protein [Puniceicoccaceae bacterium]